MSANADESSGETSAVHLPSPRSYQTEALERAIKQNTIVYLETGSGKTLIAIMLVRHYAYLLRKPSPFVAVFLVPTVVLVKQQAENVRKLVDLKVGEYWGEKGVDFWNAADWKKQQDENQLLVMTPQILHNALSHSFLRLDAIKLLIFDECHHAKKNHAYALIMKEFYHPRLRDGGCELPRILGMTASPVESKVSNSGENYWEQIENLETMMNSKVYTCSSESMLSAYIPFSTTKIKIYEDKLLPYHYHVIEGLKLNLSILKQKHESEVINSTLSESSRESAMKRLSKLHSTLEFCLEELGIFLASKAAEAYSCDKNDVFLWGQLDARGDNIFKEFCKVANKIFSSYIPNEWSISQVNKSTVSIGLLSTKVVCLIESLSEYNTTTTTTTDPIYPI